jgi:hypothetical protein
VYLRVSFSLTRTAIISNFDLSNWLINHPDSILELLQCVVMGCVEDISVVHAASVFSVGVCRLCSYCGYIALGLQTELGIK